MSTPPAEARIDVVNPQGRDAPVDYRSGVTPPDAPGHPPVNYWAFAAATGGRFHRDAAGLTERVHAVLVLIRQRVGVSLDAVRQLKAAGHTVWVSWKETGARQIEHQLRWFWHRRALTRLLAEADGALAVTPFAAAHYRAMGGDGLPVAFVPTPYPVDVAGWDFSIPQAQRRGIFVGTREFDVPGRRHAEALALAAACARETGAPVTVMNFDGARARRRIEAELAGVAGVRILEQRLPYAGYLREVARHRVVLQLDDSEVPGQVAGDALLCRLVNAGGNGAIQQVAFREWAHGDASTLQPAVVRLLTDDAHYAKAVAASQEAASQQLSFVATRRALAALRARPARA
jgi:hypothetical protein